MQFGAGAFFEPNIVSIYIHFGSNINGENMVLSKEELSKYHQGWYQRKKAGLPTRLHPLLSTTQKIEAIKIKDQNYYQDKMNKRRLLKYKYCGPVCIICGRCNKLTAHRKDGLPHAEFGNMVLAILEKELQSGNYVALCYNCHKGVHWCMQYFLLNWDEIFTKAKENKKEWLPKIKNNNLCKGSGKPPLRKDFVILRCRCGTDFPVSRKWYEWKKVHGQKTFSCSDECGMKNRDSIGSRGSNYITNRNAVLEGLKKSMTGYAIGKAYGIQKRTVYNHINRIKKENGTVAQ